MPLKYGTFSAWIEVDGAELPIFDAKEKDKEASGWIPSETGKNFVVKWSTGERKSDMCGDVYLDSRVAEGRIMHAGSSAKTYDLAGVLTSATTEKPFTFARLELTDDDQYLSGTAETLGDIQLRIYHTSIGKTIKPSNSESWEPAGKVHERSKKATGQKIDLGEAKSIPKRNTYKTISHGRIVTFRFKYRHLDMLRANGIAPQEPSSKKRTASSDEPEVVDLTGELDDSDEEELRIKELEEKLENLKQKRQKKTHVKPEPGVKPEH